MKNKVLGTVLSTGVILVIVIFVNVVLSSEDNRCPKQEQFNQKEWNGVLLKKYIDTQNHNNATLEITSKNRTFKNYDLVWSSQSNFDYLENGDSLIKKKGDNFIIVHRDGQEKQLIIDLGCVK